MRVTRLALKGTCRQFARVRTVRPRVLIRVHTEQPDWWIEQLRGTGIEVHVPVKGLPFTAP